MAPREQAKLGLATREAHFAARDFVEQVIVKEQVVELGFGQHVAYVTQLVECELEAFASVVGDATAVVVVVAATTTLSMGLSQFLVTKFKIN